MIVGIRFADNDFGNTITSFLGLFQHWDFRRNPPTKAQVVEMFNNLAPGIYLMCQNCYRNGHQEDFERMKTYLKITEKNVYLEDEVWNFYKKCWQHNGEFHYYKDNRYLNDKHYKWDEELDFAVESF